MVRRELQEFDERSTQDFLRFRSKIIGKMALDSDGLPEGVKEEVDALSATLLTRPRRKTKGEDYFYGANGVKKDVHTGVRWATVAAEAGDRDSQELLAVAFGRGHEDIDVDVSSATQGKTGAPKEYGLFACDAVGRTPVRITRNMVALTDSREHLAWSLHDFRLSSLALERELQQLGKDFDGPSDEEKEPEEVDAYLAPIVRASQAFDARHEAELEEAKKERKAKQALEAAEEAASPSPQMPDDVSDDEHKAQEQEPYDVFDSLKAPARSTTVIPNASVEIFRLVVAARSCTVQTVMTHWKEVFQASSSSSHRLALIYVLNELAKQRPCLPELQSLLRQLLTFVATLTFLSMSERDNIVRFVFQPSPASPRRSAIWELAGKSAEWQQFFDDWRVDMLQDSVEAPEQKRPRLAEE
ncbi:unnamed protein product [Symbiodinium necroappetens]|uniref:Uncharacterized protein n=1 Tax=Symbiodinium necroappetens TaxID=1628268 RepID=A0A812XZU2_9DINO|nr:unnamed protein product [Symbiodinium necroappetens]